MQGILGPSYSQLCLALNNAADGGLRLARRVKINEINDYHPLNDIGILVCFAYSLIQCC